MIKENSYRKTLKRATHNNLQVMNYKFYEYYDNYKLITTYSYFQKPAANHQKTTTTTPPTNSNRTTINNHQQPGNQPTSSHSRSVAPDIKPNDVPLNNYSPPPRLTQQPQWTSFSTTLYGIPLHNFTWTSYPSTPSGLQKFHSLRKKIFIHLWTSSSTPSCGQDLSC